MKRIRVIDFESTGTNPADGGLVEIGYCDLEARSIDLAGAPFDWVVVGGNARLCNPGCPISPESQAIHQIDDSDVAGEPHWQQLLPALLRRAEKDEVVAYAAYGADMESQYLHPTWMGENPPPMLDVYKIGLRIWEDTPPHHSNRALQYWRRPQGLNRLDALPNHRAYPDALVTAYLLRDLINDEGAQWEQMKEWSNQPALTVRCHLGDYRNDGKGTPWPEVPTSMLQWILDKGFHDKPDIRFTAAYHYDKRVMDQREERERRDLDAQLRANGMPEGPVDDSMPVAVTTTPDPNQLGLAL